MRRADDFRKFMEVRRTLADSLALLPDPPDKVDFLMKVAEQFAIAEDPYMPSGLRGGGLQVWDSAFLPFPRCVPFEPVRLGSAPVLRAVNTTWDDTKKSLEMVGRADGIHYLRPKGTYIFDLLNDDVRIVQGAHVLTHRQRTDLAKDDYTFGELSGTFIENMIRLFLCRKYDIGVNPHPEDGKPDGLDGLGIALAGSFDLRSPEMVVGFDRMVRDKTVAVVLGSVGIEAPPSKDGWRETDKWACLPTLVALAGWECVDFIAHASRTDVRGDQQPIAAVPDLQGMDSFDDLLACAESACRSRVPNGTLLVGEWLDSEDFAKGLSETPQLPCPHCLRPNRKAPGTVRKPPAQKPKAAFKELKETQYKSDDAKAWIEYVEFMHRCVETGRKATAYACGSVSTMKRRNAAFRKRAERLRKIASLTERMERKYANGFLSEADEIKEKIEKLKGE